MKYSFSCTFIRKNSWHKILSSLVLIILVYSIAHFLTSFTSIGRVIYKGILLLLFLRLLVYTISFFNYKLCRHHKKLSIDDFHDEDWTNEYATREFKHRLLYKDIDEQIFVSSRLIGFMTNEMKLYPKGDLIWMYNITSDSFLNRFHFFDLYKLHFHFTDGSIVKITTTKKKAQTIFREMRLLFPNILHVYSDKLVSLFHEDTQTFIEIINEEYR